jgi:hypothetical protein
MIKYFCDICGEELNRKDHFTYILPMRTEKVEYEEVWSNFTGTVGKRKTTRQVVEDQEVMICSKCRSNIAYSIPHFCKGEENGNK